VETGTVRSLGLWAAWLVLVAAPIPGQPVPPPAPVVEGSRTDLWSFSTTLTGYVVREDSDYLQPTVGADRGALHVEARWNYEGLDAGSLWLGWSFEGGEELSWELTPQVAGVFGSTRGVALGYAGSLAWRRLELSSEGEYVEDRSDGGASFFYSWSELAVVATDRLRLGLVTQFTRVDGGEQELQGGLLVGLGFERLDAALYWFDAEEGSPVVVLALAFDF
jgi:hypothetical protein